MSNHHFANFSLRSIIPSEQKSYRLLRFGLKIKTTPLEMAPITCRFSRIGCRRPPLRECMQILSQVFSNLLIFSKFDIVTSIIFNTLIYHTTLSRRFVLRPCFLISVLLILGLFCDFIPVSYLFFTDTDVCHLKRCNLFLQASIDRNSPSLSYNFI